MNEAIEAAVEEIVAALRADGIDLQGDGEPGQFGFRARTAEGHALSLDATAGIGVAGKLRDAAGTGGRRRAAVPGRAASTPRCEGPASARRRLDSTPVERGRLVRALGDREAEIANGGFERYLRNSVGATRCLPPTR